MSTGIPDRRRGGRIPGGLTLEDRIGEGALGEVWRAHWDGHHDPVAVKLLSPTSSVMSEDDLHRRFAVEALAAGSIAHPNAVKVLSHGNTEDGTPFVVMELLEGETLATWLGRDGLIGLEHVAQMMDDIGAALDAVHAAKLIHRDVKPQNIFVSEGPSYKLIDFGSAKHLDELAAASVPGRRTDPDVVVGTPAYLSPEMVTEPSGADHRADLWALGVTAFKCLTGQLPFAGQTLVEVCSNIMAGRLRRPTSLLPTLPRSLDLWFAYVFGSDIDSRPASGSAMARSFREAIADVEHTRIIRRRRRPRRWPLGVAALMPGALACLGAIVWLNRPSFTATADAAFPLVELSSRSAVSAAEAPAQTAVAMASPTEAEHPLAPAPLLRAAAKARVVIRGGPFLMGCTAADEDCQAPAPRTIDVPTFAIDQFEVSVLAYARCVHLGVCSDDGLRGVEGGGEPYTVSPRCNWGYPQRLQHPLNCVSYEQAATYCRFMGARLPHAEEWEKAARGVEGAIYPWGNEAASCRVAVMHEGPAGCRAEGTWPVGSKIAGASPFGAFDMAGNVREWVDDREGEARVIRGGGWDSEVGRFLRSSERETLVPHGRTANLGFRCAADAPQ